MTTRDDFLKKTIWTLAQRVAYLCSNPECTRGTIGPQADAEGTINVGVAAHITAASPGGSRFDASLTSDERRHASNGIWLCQTCSKLIDSDDQRFPIKLLREWKKSAEEKAFLEIATTPERFDRDGKIHLELDEADSKLIQGLGLPPEVDIAVVTKRLRTAAKADIDRFKEAQGWPTHAISLNLLIRDSSGTHAVTVEGVAKAIEISEEISIIAAPGTGKTTTLVQLADTILSSDGKIAVVVPLAEWSSRSDGLLQSLTRRNAFQSILEQHFMLLAIHGGLVLLLDGWNELDTSSRTRLVHELNALKRDYPLLGIAISTRQQARDAPVGGPSIEIEALSEEQQLEIARALRGTDGEALLDHAWRTTGVRELISVPLYLNALLSYATSGNMPTTKEEVLRLFVAEHEKMPEKAEVLDKELLGCHREILGALAVEATQAANTVIQDSKARAVISRVEDQLVVSGQITVRPQPPTVLDVLVNQHALIRSGANSGVSFQHQQFQEWYASFEVERLMLDASGNEQNAGKKLSAEVLDMPAWEEPILFACDRLSHADKAGVKAVAAAILRTLPIDPMLAAEMIYRAAEPVWDMVKDEAISFAGRWQKPNTVDRATGFMITTGRPEFASQIWPLVSDPDTQVHLRVFRVAKQFRPSVLGADVHTRVSELPEEIRKHVIGEIADRSGIDGIELATSLAKTDTSPDIQLEVIQSLQFRRADRYVTDILNDAPDEVWIELAQKGYAGEVADPDAVARLQRERKSLVEEETDSLSKIGHLLDQSEGDTDASQKIKDIIGSADFPAKDRNAAWTLHKAFKHFPEEVGAAMLHRLEVGLDVPFGFREFLEAIELNDNGSIPKMVIDCEHENRSLDEAMAVVGPKTVSALFDSFFTLDERLQSMEGRVDESTREKYYRHKDRISKSRPAVFLEAVLTYSDTKDPHRISLLARLLARHGKDHERIPLQAERNLIARIVDAMQCWIKVLLVSSDATRHQFADVADAIARLPNSAFVDDLRRFLSEDISRHRQAREDYLAEPNRGPMGPDVTYSHTLQYRRAFAAIGDENVIKLMEEYLPNQEFGFDAACVLKQIWDKEHNVSKKNTFSSWPDFSNVKERRLERQKQGSEKTSEHAETIFAAIKTVIVPGSTEEDQRHALRLAKIAMSMPYSDKSQEIDGLLAIPGLELEKRHFLAALVIAGEQISAEMVLDGIGELLEEAKEKPWLLDEQHNSIEHWLELLPFSDRPAALHEALLLVDARFREPWRLRRLLSALGNAPSPNAERLLGELAEGDSQFYKEYEWLSALVGRGTDEAIELLLDLICDGRLAGKKGGLDGWRLAQDLVGIIRNCPEWRVDLARRYEQLSPGEGKSVIEQIIAELADADGLMILVRGYAAGERRFDGMLYRMIENIALGKQPVADWSDAYELYSVDIATLRKELFAMLDGSATEASVAEECLNAIDEFRDEHGRIDSEPRHPDIASGHPWPLAASLS